MKIVLSPAKKLNLKKSSAIADFTKPVFIKQTEILQCVLREKTPKELAQLMKLSEKLAQENWQQNQVWTSSAAEGKAAVLTFNGEVYKGLQAETLEENAQNYLQKHMYILSGLYGLLRPYDLIMPYRLMMSTPFSANQRKNLYEYWQDLITDHLNEQLESDKILIDLASEEYIKVINRKKFKGKIIRCLFKDYKNGALKSIMIYAKKARGLMARFMAENDISAVEDLKAFDKENYRFDSKISDKTTLIFTR